MRKLALITLLALAGPALAQDLSTDTVLGTTTDQIQAKLTEMGYEIRKTETEDGQIEAYVVKDGKMSELYIDASSGQVTKIKSK